MAVASQGFFSLYDLLSLTPSSTFAINQEWQKQFTEASKDYLLLLTISPDNIDVNPLMSDVLIEDRKIDNLFEGPASM